jgi:hypothetical protein
MYEKKDIINSTNEVQKQSSPKKEDIFQYAYVQENVCMIQREWDTEQKDSQAESELLLSSLLTRDGIPSNIPEIIWEPENFSNLSDISFYLHALQKLKESLKNGPLESCS